MDSRFDKIDRKKMRSVFNKKNTEEKLKKISVRDIPELISEDDE